MEIVLFNYVLIVMIIIGLVIGSETKAIYIITNKKMVIRNPRANNRSISDLRIRKIQ